MMPWLASADYKLRHRPSFPTPSSPGPSDSASPPSSPFRTCRPTDQTGDAYHPDRLRVVASCLRVSGTVAAVRHVADGDRHILLALDPPFSNLLRPANQGLELGDLVVEPVWVGPVTQADTRATFGADPDPVTTLPTVGAHVWMEGR